MSARHSVPRLLRRAGVAACATAVAVAPLMASAGSSSAATAAREPASTPIPIATPDGLLMSYVVNAKHATSRDTRDVERAVAQAGGVVVQSWAQIGVVVAHSTRSTFRSDVLFFGGRTVDSVGATRSVAVTEGTPGAAAAAPQARAQAQAQSAAATANQARASEEATEVATDPLEAQQWDMKVIKADQAHQITDGSRRVLVGVLDSGIDADHPDLVRNLDVRDSVNCSDAGKPDLSPTGWEPTTSDHGTHVAGTIAAARNSVGIVGVAPNVRIASVKVVNDDGFIYPEYAVCGFVWAGMKHMDVTNNSYFVDPYFYWCEDQPDQAAGKEAVRRAVQWSTKQGVVHSAAAGNEATDLANNTTDPGSPDDAATPVARTINSGCEDIPAELDGVVTVSSLQEFPTGSLQTRLSSFSNRGLRVIDVAAPGSTILSTVVANNGYGLKSGTSMASPHVAGVLALMKSVHPTWQPNKLIERLERQADDKACSAATAGPACVGPVRDNSFFGDGVVDALDAVR